MKENISSNKYKGIKNCKVFLRKYVVEKWVKLGRDRNLGIILR